MENVTATLVDGVEFRRSAVYPTVLVAADGSIIGPTGRVLRHQTLNAHGHQAVGLYPPREKPGPTMTYVHRILAAAWLPNPEGYPVLDHIDGNPRNNTLANLRWATQRTNSANSHRRREGQTTSRYVGVCWSKTGRKWVAAIQLPGKTQALAYTEDEQEAARAYDAALEALGFPAINFPTAQNQPE